MSNPHLIIAHDADSHGRLARMLVSERVAHDEQRRRAAYARLVLPSGYENRQIYYTVSAVPPNSSGCCDHPVDTDVQRPGSRSDEPPDPRQSVREAARARRWRYSR